MRNKRPTNASLKGGTFNENDPKNESQIMKKLPEVEEGHRWSELLESRENPQIDDSTLR